MLRQLKNVKKRHSKRELLLWIFAFFVFLGGLLFLWVSTFELPTLDSFEQRRVAESTKIYDRSGEILLYGVNQNLKRTVVPFEEISRNVKNATIAIEDQEFYSHSGVKPSAFLRAVLVNLGSLEFSQGGSTITQQVVKNSLLTNEKRISRKIKEWVLAIKLEKVLNKDEILSMYLNEIPYGGSIYGIEEASQGFFNKPSSDLTIAEAAYLAALPQAPTYYSPYGNHIDKLKERKNLVLAEMLQNNFITQSEYDQALVEEVSFKQREDQNIKAPHFVFYVMDYLEKKYGEEVLRNGGLHVVTTLDYELQTEGEEIAKRKALENQETFNAENAAFVVIDPKTGQILTMVGSRDYFDEEIDGNFNIATAKRQPGSTFKPFVYAQAFSKGYTPNTVLFDLKTQFSTSCAADNSTSDNGCYSPDNYDHVFRGPMTMREALAQSVNIPSVKTLYLAGITESLNLAEKMGISTLTNAGRYGLTLVLGGGEVSLLDMTSAYGVFGNIGIRNPHVAILEIKDRDDNTLEIFEQNSRQVLDSNVTNQISDVLSDNEARAPAFGQTSYLYIPDRDVAVKTGTTNDYRDAWIIGYSPNVVLGAWAGNNDNSPMEKKVAGFIVAPMWREFMDKILAKYPAESFQSPSIDNTFDLKPVLRGKWVGGNSYLIDKSSKKLATEFTPLELTDEILTGGVHSILYWVEKDNPRGPIPSRPETDPQFRLWEHSVQKWLVTQSITTATQNDIPETFDDVHRPEYAPKISVSSPKSNASFGLNTRINVVVQSSGKYSLSKIEYFVDGVFIGDAKNYPFLFSFIPEESNISQGGHILKVVAYDSVLNRGESTVSFDVI